MKQRNLLKVSISVILVAVLAIALTLVGGCAAPAPTPEPTPEPTPAPTPEPTPAPEPAEELPIYEWRCQTTWGAAQLPDVAAYWKDYVESASGGRIKIRLYSTGELMPDDQLLRALEEESMEVSIGQGINWASPIDIIDMDCIPPFTWKSPEDAWMLWEHKGLKEIYVGAYEELPNIKIVAMAVGDPIHLISSKPIWSYDDLDGLKINCPRMAAPVFESAGAVSVYLPWEEWYLAGQTGALEGVVWMGAKECVTNSFNEVYPNFLTNPVNGAAMYYVAMGKRLYDSLDPHLQAVLDWSEYVLAFRSNKYYYEGEISSRPLLNLTAIPDEDWARLQDVAWSRWDTEIAPISPRAAKLVEILKEYTQSQ